MVESQKQEKGKLTESLTEAWDSAPNRKVLKWVVLTSTSDLLDAYFFVGSSLSIIVLGLLIHLSLFNEIYLTSSFMIGIFLGAIISGKISDKIGRKTLFKWDMLALGIIALITGIVVSQIFFLPLMASLGFVIGMDVPSAWVLTAEFSPKNSRAGNLGIGFTFWVAGASIPYWVLQLSSGLSAYDRLHLLFWVPAVFAFALFFLRNSLVESPRWLLLKNREGDAEREAKLSFGYDFNNIKSVTGKRNKNELQGESFSFLQFIKNNYSLFFSVFFMYMGVALFANTFSLYAPFLYPKIGVVTFFQKTVEFTLGWSLPQVISLMFVWRPLYERSRKSAFRISAYSSFVAILLLTISYALKLPSIIDLSLVVVFLFLSVGVQLAERVWSSELWPTNNRATAQGQIWGWRHFPLIFWGVFIFPALSSSIGVVAIFGIITLVLVMIIILGHYLPDTAGKSLEEIESSENGVSKEDINRSEVEANR